MTTSVGVTVAAGPGGPRPVAPPASQTDSNREKKDLASWWKNFKRGDKKGGPEPVPAQGIFGVPLPISIRYANVAISLFNEEGQSYIYGYVPIVVAKCGVFLKEKATDVEGIFRLAGSEKRIKELKVAFDSPDRYGKGLNWDGYTVHDAANILRRYFNQLPEPIIPLEFYQRFRDPLRNHQAQAVGSKSDEKQSTGSFDADAAIKTYQALITELPPLNRQLLLYILDLLAVFASKSDMNKMTTPNLAAIFQPGILNHPQHDMAPQEYRLSQDILIFLIENQDSFLIGMQGTAADAQTVRDVQSGSPKPPSTPSTPNRSRTVINRSASNSSVAAESVRKFGSIRRNLSVSSKKSKQSDGAPTPVTAASPASTNGVHRSNTVPSRRGGSGAAPSPRFQRERVSGSPVPTPAARSLLDSPGYPDKMSQPLSVQNTPVSTSTATFVSIAPPPITSVQTKDFSTTPEPTVTVVDNLQTPKKDSASLLTVVGGSAEKPAERSISTTPSANSSRKFLDILKQSPNSDNDTRKPNKLQKKRLPGTSLSSAHSSSHSLQDTGSEAAPRSPISPRIPPSMNNHIITELPENTTADFQATPVAMTPPRTNAFPATNQRSSPAASFHSHTDDTSDPDMVGDDMPPASDKATKEKKRWRFSRQSNKVSSPAPVGSIGTMTARDLATSRSTIGSTIGSSAASQPRKSFQESATPLATVPSDPATSSGESKPPALSHPATDSAVFSDSERERRAGPMSWIRGKLQERKDNRDAEKRSRTPDRNSVGTFHHERSKSRQELQSQQHLPTSAPTQVHAASSAGPVETNVVPVIVADNAGEHSPRPATAEKNVPPPTTALSSELPTTVAQEHQAPTSTPSMTMPTSNSPTFTTWAPAQPLVLRSHSAATTNGPAASSVGSAAATSSTAPSTTTSNNTPEEVVEQKGHVVSG